MNDAPSQNTLELEDVSHQANQSRDSSLAANGDDALEGENGQSLPPYDGGRVAWRILLAMFVFEALLWGVLQTAYWPKPSVPYANSRSPGFPLSFGVFQNYYSQLPEFKDDPYVSVIGTTASGIIYMAAPVVIPFIRRFARWRRKMIWIGWPICLLGLIAGSFARSLPTLIFTQGIMYGVGFITFYYPMLSMVNEFWIARRGMAYGLLCSASGVSGAALPFCMEKLLEKYGYPTTLRITAAGLFVLTGPLIPLLKGRLPESQTSAVGRTDWGFLKVPLFWIYSASNLAMGLGYFFPSLYIPSYATANGMSSVQGAVLLVMMSIAQVLGQFSFGYLSDRNISLNFLTASSTLVAAAAVYVCWGLAHSFKLLITFALIYGFFGAGYTAMWCRMGTAVCSDSASAFASFGLLCFGKGVGNVLAGPLSGALMAKAVDVDSYGTLRYQAVVLFTGSCMFLSAAIVPLCYLKRLPGMH